MSRKKCCCASGCIDPICEEGNCDAVLYDCGTIGPLGFGVEIEMTCRPASCDKYDEGPGDKCPNVLPVLGFGALNGCPRGGVGWEGTAYADCPSFNVIQPPDGGMYPTWVCTPMNPLSNNQQVLFEWASHWTGNYYQCPAGYAENTCFEVNSVEPHGQLALTFGNIGITKTISSAVGWVTCPAPGYPASAMNYTDLRETHGVFGMACGECGAGMNICCDPNVIETPCACDCLGGGKTNYQLLSPTNNPHDGVVYGRIAWFSPCTGPSDPSRAAMWCGGGCSGDYTHRASMFALEILATFAVSVAPDKVPVANCPDLPAAITTGPNGDFIQLQKSTLHGVEADGRVWRYEQRHVWVMFKHCNDMYTGEGNKCRMQLGDYIPIRTGICVSDLQKCKGCCDCVYEVCDPDCIPPEVECACSEGIFDLMRRAGWDFTKVKVI